MKERAGRSRRLPPSAWLFDSGLALVAAGLSTAFFVELVGRGVPRGTLALGYGLVLLHTLPLAARRRFPGTVLGISVGSGLASAALGLPPVVLGVAILVAVYSVAAYGTRWVSLAGLAAAELGSAAVQLTPGRFEWPTPVSNALVIGAAWLLGHFVGVRRAYTVQLERTRAEVARRAVAEEAAKALAAIEATSRAALTELRRLLGVLRQDGESQGDLAPVPGLADLDALLAEVAKAGLAVRLRVEGTPSQLPAGVDLSAYRIVQEGLTNVVKHAGPARAQVTIGYGDREVTVEIVDNGRGMAAPTDNGRAELGHGLIGMRERVQMFDGELQAGPRPGGGFRVAARLPLAVDRR